MDGILGFLSTVWSSFSALSAVEQISMALSFPVTLAAIWGATTNFYRRKTKRLSADVAAEAARTAEQMRKRVQLEEELELVKAELPENWMTAVAKERRDGNEERAIGRLRDRMRDVGPEIAKAADELASYHLSVGDDLGTKHFAEAKRYARLGVLHDSTDAIRSAILDEITEIELTEEPISKEGLSDWDDLHAAFPTGEDGLRSIGALNNATIQRDRQGHYYVAERLNRRAHLLALRNATPDHPLVLGTRLLGARVLYRFGRYDDALDEIDILAPTQRAALGSSHPDVFMMHRLKTEVLTGLGRYDDALAEINAYAYIERRALGADDLGVLRTHHLRAEVLDQLWRSDDALDEIDILAPTQRAALGANHPNVLATRFLRARVLSHLERYDDAITEIDDFAALHHAALGANHPNVLATHLLRARVLSHLERYDDALAEIDTFAPIQRAALGAHHPEVLGTQYDRAKVLDDLCRYDDALAEINAFAAIQRTTFGANHPNVLATHFLRARVLSHLERYDDALAEIDTFAPIERAALDANHPSVERTASLKTKILDALKVNGSVPDI